MGNLVPLIVLIPFIAARPTVGSRRPARIEASTAILAHETVADHSLFTSAACDNRHVATAASVHLPPSVSRLTLPALAIAYGAASVAVAFGGGVPTTYAATSANAAAADLAAGLGLIVAGMVAWLERPVGSLGPLTTLLGVAWLAPDWVGWEDGPALFRSLGMVAAPFLLPLLAHVVLAFPAGRIGAPVARVAVAVVYGGATVVSVGRALTRDPFLDPYCWSNCTDNVFLVHSDQGLARALDDFWLRFSPAVGLLLVAVAIWRLLSTTRAGRAALAPVLLGAALAAGAEAAYAFALLHDPAEVPESALFRAVFFARALALACLAGGVVWTVLRGRRTRSAVSRLATDLGEAPQPGSLRAALARSLGDEALEVAYWLPDSRRYVDAAGRPVEPPTDKERGVTPIVRGSEPVALVVHDRGLSGARELEREIGAAARLAVDNERLRAEVLAQLEDLRASRARIVETGDAARRGLERDLHDGAQQRLLALSYDLRIAHARAEADGDAETASLLAEATGEAQAALAELRELAHGIYPAILTEAGFAAGLETLADAAPLPVEIGGMAEERYTAAVETAAYFVVAEAIADAARRGASYAAVSALRDEELLVVEVEDDGSERTSALVHLADRVGALGGRLEVEPMRLQAEIPCIG
jgi:signal transduction histidine kinase